MAAGARYSHLPLSWHNQPACGPACTEPKVQKARPLRVHISTRGSEQPFELQPAMKAMSEGSASGSVLPTWVGRAWRVSIFKWAAIGQWPSGRARWAASPRSWGTVGMACGSAPRTRPASVRCSTPRASRTSGAPADRRGRPQKKLIAKDIRATALRSSSTATERRDGGGGES